MRSCRNNIRIRARAILSTAYDIEYRDNATCIVSFARNHNGSDTRRRVVFVSNFIVGTLGKIGILQSNIHNRRNRVSGIALIGDVKFLSQIDK